MGCHFSHYQYLTTYKKPHLAAIVESRLSSWLCFWCFDIQVRLSSHDDFVNRWTMMRPETPGFKTNKELLWSQFHRFFMIFYFILANQLFQGESRDNLRTCWWRQVTTATTTDTVKATDRGSKKPKGITLAEGSHLRFRTIRIGTFSSRHQGSSKERAFGSRRLSEACRSMSLTKSSPLCRWGCISWNFNLHWPKKTCGDGYFEKKFASWSLPFILCFPTVAREISRTTHQWDFLSDDRHARHETGHLGSAKMQGRPRALKQPWMCQKQPLSPGRIW